MRLLLASKSVARRHMLEAAGVPFETVEAELDEDAAKAGLWGAGFDARGVAEELAQLKALSVSAGDGDLVLGSDQTLERGDGSLLGKPASRDEARG
ncbi:MAG: Maf family protein, partial [Allosphingosinicella sp.]